MVPKIPILLVSPKFSEFHFKDVEKSRFRSRSRDYCQIFEGFGFGFGKIWYRKKVLVSVSENLVSEEKYRFQKNLVSEKSLGFGKFGIGKKVLVSVSIKIMVMSKFTIVGFDLGMIVFVML